MADIQYDPACMDCRHDAVKDPAGTTWQCNVHVRAERDWLRAKLANVMVEWKHDVEVLTKERNAALKLSEQRGAAYDMTWREVESLREWKDKLEAERDALLASPAPPASRPMTRDEADAVEEIESAMFAAPPADAATEAVREAAISDAAIGNWERRLTDDEVRLLTVAPKVLVVETTEAVRLRFELTRARKEEERLLGALDAPPAAKETETVLEAAAALDSLVNRVWSMTPEEAESAGLPTVAKVLRASRRLLAALSASTPAPAPSAKEGR